MGAPETIIGSLPAGLIAEDILANFTEALLVLNREWRIVYANEAASQICVTGRGDLVGQNYWEAWPTVIGTDAETQYRRAMDERISAEFEQSCTGSEVWLGVHVYPCETGIAIYCHDISEQKRAEAGLRQRESELSDFLRNATMALHWVGPDGTILWANEAELKMLGYAREEYVGHSITEFHMDAPVIADILQRLKNNEELHGYEARLRCKDGGVRDVAINSNVYWQNGKFIHTRCFTRDITDTKRSAELRERLAAIVESSDDAIISKDLQGIIRSWNRGAERIFGYTAKEAIGQPVAMLAVGEHADEIPNIIQRISRGERVDHFETKRKRKDGRVLTVSLTVSPIRDASGRIIGASKVARDITERVRSEQALQAANGALSRSNADLEEFAYSASHDLQEPLRMVATYTEMLQKKFGGKLGAEGDQYIGYAIAGALRMEQLLKDLRTYTQASTLGEGPTTDVDANKALEDVLLNLGSAIAESGASITHTHLPMVCVHEVALEQVFQNLIGNALRYRSHEPPRIHVAAERRGWEWCFSVSDNGIGIAPQYKEQIFGLFKRLHSAAEYPGSGMGLAICERIVHRFGGRIWVESELGRGATFFFSIPVSGSA